MYENFMHSIFVDIKKVNSPTHFILHYLDIASPRRQEMLNNDTPFLSFIFLS